MRNNNIDWGFVSVIVAVLIVAVGWGVSVEIRMAQQASLQTIQESIDTVATSISSLNYRTQNIEKLVVPVIVDYKVRKEVEERILIHKEKMSKIPKLMPEDSTIRSPTFPIPPIPLPNVQQTPEMVNKAEKWTQEQIKKGQAP